MHAHNHKPSEPRTQRTGRDETADAVTPVGTFAAGQSPQGSFEVAADAVVGNFASGLEESDAATTDRSGQR